MRSCVPGRIWSSLLLGAALLGGHAEAFQVRPVRLDLGSRQPTGQLVVSNPTARPLLIQAEQKLINQADELVVLADSSKFAGRSSLLLCPLSRIHTVITDDRIEDRAAQMLEAAEIRLIVAELAATDRKGTAQEE